MQDATGGREVISQKIKEEGAIQQEMRQKYLGRSGGQRTSKGEMCNMSIIAMERSGEMTEDGNQRKGRVIVQGKTRRA